MTGRNKDSVISLLEVFGCQLSVSDNGTSGLSDLTLSISPAGQHSDGFPGSGQILDEFPGVLSFRRHGASHVSASGLSVTQATQEEITQT